MSVKEVAELLLRRTNGASWSIGQFGSITGGIEGMLQRDINQALGAWRAGGDTAGFGQVAATMHAYGKLTDADYAQIMEMLDGES